MFQAETLPQYIATTARALPGIERLPVNAQGALVSLVYNRGPGFGLQGQPSWDKRREMRAVRDEVAKTRPSLSAIAAQLRAMKRLWVNSDVPGLLTWREAEARLVEQAV